MYKFSIKEVHSYDTYMVIYFTWFSKNQKEINDLMIIYDDGTWNVRFDYHDAGGISKAECDLYYSVAAFTRTPNFRMLYVK